ncbi:MAG: flagellar biosynthetic protein FliO [Clostridiales bacterium]|nr:flagellar biosynthetic protein FliO [Clostridiales bacterium]
MLKEILHILLLLAGFAAVLLAAYLATRFMGSKMSYSNNNNYIKVVERIFLANDKSICIIQVGEGIYLLGVTNHHIELISELKLSDLVPVQDDKGSSFNNLFDGYLKKFRNNSKEDDQDGDRLRQIKEGLEKHKKTFKM